jgi:reactive intermediate/imine deaminase
MLQEGDDREISRLRRRGDRHAKNSPDDKGFAMQFIASPDDAKLGLPFCAAVRVADVLYLSGAIGNRPGTLTLAEGGIAAEAHQAMDNIGRTLAACGLGFADVVKCTVMLADIGEWRAFNEVYVGYFAADRLPARSAFGATGLALGARVEIECLARFPHAAARS